MGFAIIIIIAAVFSSVFRALTPWATEYKTEVESHLSTLIGQPVTVQSMETGWYWFQPVLKLKDINIHDGKKEGIHLDKLYVGIDLFKSLWKWHIEPGVLYMDDMHLVVREKDGLWHIDGIATSALASKAMSSDKVIETIAGLAQQERLIIRHVSVRLYTANGTIIPINGVNLSIINSGGYYKLKGEARLDKAHATTFQLIGNLSFDAKHLEKTEGQIYLSAHNIAPAQWKTILPKTAAQLDGGRGDISLWVDLKKGAISSVQAQVHFKQIAWHHLLDRKKQLIKSLSANTSWKPDAQGWEFKADHLHLQMSGKSWPENQVMLKFNKAQQIYQLYVKSILLESLFSEKIKWPQSLQEILQMKPKGTLTDTQLFVKDGEFNAILTRFDHLNWQAKDKIPVVENLSGVLNWQPEEGRLELDSEQTKLAVAGFPTQKFDVINAAVEWKEISTGLRVSVERFVLSQPELTLSAEGAADQVGRDSLGNIRLDAAFSGKNIEQWIALIPPNLLKPKLDKWLKTSINKIAEGTGKVTVNGMAKDFPFDANNGEFSIVSHVKGVELYITPKWQLINDLEGFIRFKNRDLDIDVVNGDIQGVPVKQLNIRIDGIGKDKESLLIYSLLNAPLDKMQSFIMHSPLEKKLSTLNMLSMQGLAFLKLNVEVLLYRDVDDVFVKGELSFKDNSVQVKHGVGSVTLDDVTGDLAFDEKGITQSALKASVFSYPLTIRVQSVKEPKFYTTVLIDGECSADSLKSRINSPLLSFIKGSFSYNANFKITEDPNDLDSLQLVSSLEGLAINLPAPLGKVYTAKTPLEVKLDFNSQKAIRIRANYDGHLSTDILFNEHKGFFELQSGQVRLGAGQVLDQKKPGLAVVGSLKGFDLEEWKKLLMHYSTGAADASWLHKLRIIHVSVEQVTFLKEQFDKLIVQAKILPNNDWSFGLSQKKIDASLYYHPATNLISGYIKRLQLSSLAALRGDKAQPPLDLHPDQIPNLNLRIDNFTLGEQKIGNITIKSKSTKDRWQIDYCQIDSPFYLFKIQGDWTQKDNKNHTQLHVKMNLKSLAKTLDSWKISPAVDAGKGDMQFIGGWNKPIYDFSLATLNGRMYLELKKGIITHLSPETEEKLGLGKLLSILSLQTIPRRLQLDFSDLSHQGYSFDIFKGNFMINKGIMSTQDSYLDGPVAYASMKGNLDLVSKIYDLDLRISPHITASLPIVATIAGGPIAGVAAWVVNKIINQSMQKISAYTYKVSGPWSQPVVQQVSIVKKKIQKKA